MFVLNNSEKLNYLESENLKAKVLEAPFEQTKSCIRHCYENKYEKYFYKYIEVKESLFPDNLNQSNYTFYSINEENFCLYKSEDEIKLHSFIPNEVSKDFNLLEKFSNLYCSHIYIDEFLLINYENEVVLLKGKFILGRFKNEKYLSSKNIICLKKISDIYILGFYDNQMNISFVELNTLYLKKAFEIASSNLISNNDIRKLSDKMDISEDEYLYLKKVIFIDGINFLKDNIPLRILNEFDNCANYCLDSILLKSNNDNLHSSKVYAICGERGKSKLIYYERALKEIRLANFEYNQIKDAILAQSSNGKECVLFFNTYMLCKAFYFGIKNSQIEFYDLTSNRGAIWLSEEETLDAFYLQDNKTILQITTNGIYAFGLIQENLNSSNKQLNLIDSIILREKGQKINILSDSITNFKKLFLEENDISIVNLKHIYSEKHNKIFMILIISNFKICILSCENNCNNLNLKEETIIDHFTTVSAFDITIDNDNLLIITGTYDNKLEILKYEILNKQLFKKNECILESENSDIVPESIKIAKNNSMVFISTRIGKFAIFSLESFNCNLNFLGSFYPNGNEIEPLIISDCIVKENNNYEFTLYSNNNSYLLEINFSEDCKNMNSKLSKYLVEKKIIEQNINISINKYENICLKNYINFFLNINLINNNNNNNFNNNQTQISIYQNNNLICFSHFQKVVENTLLINKIKDYEKNFLAKKIIEINFSNICILYNKLDRNKNCLIWGLNLISLHDLKENYIDIESQNQLKVNVIKIFHIEFQNMDCSDEENKFKYIILGGEFVDLKSEVKKGIFYVYKIVHLRNNYFNLEYTKKYIIADPIIDLCHINNNLIFTCNNYIYSTQIEIDNINRKIEIIPKNMQSHMNKLISCESVSNSNCIVVGDVNESFNLMELDTRSFRFEVAAAELSLKTLYKGNYYLLSIYYILVIVFLPLKI